MKLLKKLFGKSRSTSHNAEAKDVVSADDHWEEAIAAAESGQAEVAFESFQRAIKLKPDYFISTVQPASSRAKAIWKQAVDEYIKQKDAKNQNSNSAENHCMVCSKDLGLQWHYMFESLSLGDSVGAQCSECNFTVCTDHIDGGEYKPNPCPKCGSKVFPLIEGPASSSLVEQALSERRYRGVIKEPSKLGRDVIER